ncbi:hypothetical protein QYE76_035668 [Lolium multiflorum]|uniref:CCHC-type domain-containing protein n=1 Tax=Lolium multiflorum TaxID=4521 RepID=A0AAD8R0W9_LOLMU|nr:hypothetical protein QYE76_035668 [Lolium multiflorum]
MIPPETRAEPDVESVERSQIETTDARASPVEEPDKPLTQDGESVESSQIEPTDASTAPEESASTKESPGSNSDVQNVLTEEMSERFMSIMTRHAAKRSNNAAERSNNAAERSNNAAKEKVKEEKEKKKEKKGEGPADRPDTAHPVRNRPPTGRDPVGLVASSGPGAGYLPGRSAATPAQPDAPPDRAPLAYMPPSGCRPPGWAGPTGASWAEEIKELEAQVLSLKKDLEKRHEGKSALDKMLSVQQSPNDKSGLGFNSNNKNKSKSKNNKKKGQDKVKDSAKIVCFKCKVEGHHVRSCPLKKKKHLSEKQQGKRPQGQGQGHARPQVEDRLLPKKNQDFVPQEKKSIKKKKGNTCYLCRKKGHFASSCLGGTLSNPIIVDDDYSLGKDKDGNVFAKFVGTQSGLKKRTIWVAKPIVTNLLGPNLVGDQQAQT